MLYKAMTDDTITYDDIIEAQHEARRQGLEPTRVELADIDALLEDENMVEVPDASGSATASVASLDVDEGSQDVLVTRNGTEIEI